MANKIPREFFIVKVQRPVFTGDRAEILVYNADRTLYQTFEYTAQLHMQLFPNNELKVFWYARIIPGTTTLDIRTALGRPAWQDW